MRLRLAMVLALETLAFSARLRRGSQVSRNRFCGHNCSSRVCCFLKNAVYDPELLKLSIIARITSKSAIDCVRLYTKRGKKRKSRLVLK